MIDKAPHRTHPPTHPILQPAPACWADSYPCAADPLPPRRAGVRVWTGEEERDAGPPEARRGRGWRGWFGGLGSGFAVCYVLGGEGGAGMTRVGAEGELERACVRLWYSMYSVPFVSLANRARARYEAARVLAFPLSQDRAWKSAS